MSRLGLYAVLAALVSASAASACCLFKKCCTKSASPAPRTVIVPAPSACRIVSIGGIPTVPSPGEITVPFADLEVVVESSAQPGFDDQLHVTEEGPVSVAAKGVKKYKPHTIKAPKSRYDSAAAAPGSPTGGLPDPSTMWLAIYTIKKSDLKANFHYSAFAFPDSCTTPTVKFKTGP